jgi:hypothetical protein
MRFERPTQIRWRNLNNAAVDLGAEGGGAGAQLSVASAPAFLHVYRRGARYFAFDAV